MPKLLFFYAGSTLHLPSLSSGSHLFGTEQWLLQVQPGGYIRFDHGVEEIMGTHLLSDSKHLI